VNGLKTTMLLAALTGILVGCGYFLGEMYGGGSGSGQNWALIALLSAGVMNFIMFWFSDRIVLSMYKAQQVGRSDSPQLYGIVERLARNARMPMPKVYVIPTETPNAFATGRSPSKASVAATLGILRILSEEELEGVMAHELAHVKHRDTLTSTVAATFAGAIGYLARIMMFSGGRRGRGGRNGGGAAAIGAIVIMIVAPIAAMLIQMAISRSREYAADAEGAYMCRNPNALANALLNLQKGVTRTPMQDIGNPATSHMFIINPFKADVMMKLFSTHPPTEERVRKLREMRV